MTKHTSEEFNKAFASLNARQQEAVNQIEGPVLVIAGPGTGKTQILAARIANILSSTDALPENILCLTYTDAGSVAMRKRLLSFIGATAYRIPIYTFHSFCNTVIQDNLDYFGVSGLDAVSDLERIRYVHEIIDGFTQNHPLKRYTGDVYYEAEKLLSLYSNMKREHWSSAFLEQKTQAYLADLPTRDTYIYKRNTKTNKAGDIKQKDLDAEILKMTALIAAAKTFDDYQEKLRQNNRYDFDDMIVWVINAFKDKPDLLNTYREKYLYFLVDEFQDTNGSQNELLELLVDYWDSPNVFCVGDDDQSIFRFQGANVENVAHYIQKYKPHTVTLEDNYRSNQYILDAAKVLISHNQNRINNNKILFAKNEAYTSHPVKPEIQIYNNPIHEVACIARQILDLQKQGTPLNEIAVLYRKHKQAEDLITYLQYNGVGINTRKKQNILEEPLVKRIIRLLRYIDAEITKPHTGEAYIYELLHYDFFNNQPLDIAAISVEVYRKNFNDRVTSWREELKKRGNPRRDLFSQQEGANSLAKTSALLEGWIKDAANLTIQQLIEKILNESGILIQALTGDDKAWNMQVLHTFFNFVKEECSRSKKTTLSKLLQTILLMEKEGVTLDLQRIVYSEDGVNFITAHSSKGLEFEHVFIIGATTNAWEKSRPLNQYKLPDTLFDLASADDAEESRRLFYVALTRAKKQVVVSYAEQNENGKNLEKSRFVAELEEYSELVQSSLHATDDELIQFQLATYSVESQETKPDLFDHALVDSLLENYSLSVTHLNNYLKCPTAFYFNNLIRVPAPLSASMTFGSAAHHALEMLFKNMNNHPEKQFADVHQFVNDFSWYMRRHEDSFIPTEFQRRMEYGVTILTNYYNKYISDWNKITSVERSYRNVEVEGVPLNGKLDKLEFDGNIVNVVDYKTGQFENARHKFGPPDLELYAVKKDSDDKKLFEYQFGGDYWRQAVFYKILMDNDKARNWEMISAEFDFVEPDKKTGEYFKQKVLFSSDDIHIVKQQIQSTYDSIKSKSFEKGCGKKECEWCSFVSNYYAGKPLTMPKNLNAEA